MSVQSMSRYKLERRIISLEWRKMHDVGLSRDDRELINKALKICRMALNIRFGIGQVVSEQ